MCGARQPLAESNARTWSYLRLVRKIPPPTVGTSLKSPVGFLLCKAPILRPEKKSTGDRVFVCL